MFAVVVVVTYFDEIPDDFLFFAEIVFSMKINNQFGGLTVVFRGKVTISIGRETKTHIVQTKINETNSLRSASLTIIIVKE